MRWCAACSSATLLVNERRTCLCKAAYVAHALVVSTPVRATNKLAGHRHECRCGTPGACATRTDSVWPTPLIDAALARCFLRLQRKPRLRRRRACDLRGYVFSDKRPMLEH